MKAFALLSPTWAFADFIKRKRDRTHVIQVLNSVYLWISLLSVTGVLIFQAIWREARTVGLNDALPYAAVFLWSYFLLSRCNEIFWAFLKDALDKMDAKKSPESSLSPSDRIRLSLKSYLELIIDFSLLYALLPGTQTLWGNGKAPFEITNALYFSGVTITTLGYGDISPNH